ncbi:MAG: ribonuclease T [Rhodobacter sp.]|nr:ribonuclease T [Paracoccaceae bacterium]MCC0080255.1 ribonuclease T [Rhodobacter sp.]
MLPRTRLKAGLSPILAALVLPAASLLAAGLLAAGLFAAAPARAQDRAGQFDHYLLALSWIPAYCATDGDDRNDPRCRDGRHIGWAVHGLWPQNTGGDWPEHCLTTERDPSRRETAAQADLFGTSGSAWHQWDKHGRCSGLSAHDYYDLVQRAVDTIHLPEVFAGVDRALRIDPDVIEAAFIEANPDLTEDMMVTSCQRGDLVELRICLTRDLEPMACDPATTRRECALNAATLLPLR